MKLTEMEKRFISHFELTETQYAALPRLSLQEIVEKTVEQRKIIQANMEATKPSYDFQEANLIMGLGDEDKVRVIKSLAQIPLSRIMTAAAPELGLKLKTQEFLAKSSTTGLQGAAYLIPDKIFGTLFEAAVETDITEEISIMVIPAEQIPGAELKVDVEEDGTFKPFKFSSGGKQPAQEITTKQPKLDFTVPWGINFSIGNDLIEDSQFDMIEFHVRQAGREFGEYATNLALTVMAAGTDGDGSINGGASGNAAETKFTGATTTDLVDLHRENWVDGYNSTHIIMCPHAFWHSVVSTGLTAGASEYSTPWAYNVMVDGLPSKILGCKVLWTNVDAITNSQAFTEIVTLMFTKQYSLLSGRKRWLRLENYSDPVRDLVGATITARTDSITIYNDSIGKITETA